VTRGTTDDARWAEAMSILQRAPTESAQLRLQRHRRHLVLLMSGLVIGGLGLGLVLFLVLFPGSASSEGEEPLWREVTSLVLAAVGLVLAVAVIVALLRSNRRLHSWRGNPLAPLTASQKRLVGKMARGRAPVPPDRLPLARYAAEATVAARVIVAQQAGIVVILAGQWIGEPTTLRLALLAFFTVLSVPLGMLALSRAARARRFLAQHPATADAA
jgi:hypothetical protein